MTGQKGRANPEGKGWSGTRSCRAYQDGEAVVSLQTVLVTLLLGVLAAPQLRVGGEIQVVVHNLTPLHEEQRRVLVQNVVLIQVAGDLVGYLTGLREGEGGKGGKGGVEGKVR